MSKGPDAFRTISEVAGDLDLPQHVLRFWETRFSQIKPMKRGGGRRYYRPDDVALLRGIRHLLYGEGYTIRGVQRILKEQGPRAVIAVGKGEHPGFGPQEEGDLEPERGAAQEERPRRERAPSQRIEPSFEAAPPRAPQPRPAKPVRADPPTAAEVEAPGLAPDDVERLKETLAELLECKRLLDQVR